MVCPGGKNAIGEKGAVMGYSTVERELREQAENAWRGENFEQAEALFRELAAVLADPADAADAAFFAEAAAALEDGAEYRRIAPLASSAEEAVAALAQRSGSGKDYFDGCRRIVSAVIEVASCHYDAVAAYWKKEQKKRRRSSAAPAEAQSVLTDCVAAVCAAARQTVGAALTHAEDFSAADDYFWTALLTLLDNAETYRIAAELGGDPEIAALLEEIDRLRGNVFGEYAGEEEPVEDAGEYAEVTCPGCGETLSFPAEALADGKPMECPFCGSPVGV